MRMSYERIKIELFICECGHTTRSEESNQAHEKKAHGTRENTTADPVRNKENRV